MDSKAVALTLEDSIATITLDQPSKRNAFSYNLLDGIVEALDIIDPGETRCVVIDADGPTFSAGGNHEMMDDLREDTLAGRRQKIEDIHKGVIAKLVQYPLPTIAKVRGTALGGGANIAIACDVQLASEDAEIGFIFRRVGLCVDTGTSYLLPRIVGANKAKELIYTGTVLDAEDAEDIGLFNHVYPEDEFEDRADDFIGQIADGPTVALKNGKQLVNRSLNSTLEQSLEAEAMAQAEIFDTNDFEEGLTAIREQRHPEFTGS
jgi:enoyl-CoA hydratase/carnithine racemase